ncbi:MAG: biotin/lipoyl-containing protein, partial [Bacteroidota bacterium]
MAEVILMPRLSDTMTEGVIAAWHKKVGDPVKKGDLLAEIETDKATMELESYKDGTLLHIGGEKGVKIQVDDLLAIVGKAGEDISSLLKTGNSSAAASKKEEPKKEEPKKEESKKEEPKKEESKKGETKKEEPKKETALAEKPAPAKSAMIDVSKMDEVVLMPRLSDTMEEGVIAAWHKNVGDTVKKGEVLAEIETDKATMELESYKNGTLLHIGAQKGEKIPVNGLLCIIGEKGKVDIDAIVAAVKGGISQESGVDSQQSSASSQQSATESSTVPSEPEKETAQTEVAVSSSTDNGRVKASPLAKKLAAEKGIDIKAIAGSGDGGRIIKADIDNYKQSAVSSTPSAIGSGQSAVGSTQPAMKTTTAAVPAFTAGQEGFTDIPNSQIRGIIAKRLAESKFSAPHFYLTMEIN